MNQSCPKWANFLRNPGT